MTVTALHHERDATATPSRHGLAGRMRRALGAFFSARRHRREERRTLAELTRFDARHLRDLGIEPMDVYDAMHGKRSASALFEPMRRSGEK